MGHPALAEARSIAAHHPLGASTGHLSPRGDWDALLHAARGFSTLAVELAAISEPEFLTLAQWLPVAARGLPFRFLSVHAPSKHRTLTEAELVAALAMLPADVDAIVVHPDTIEDVEAWRVLGATLVLENMDDRKPTGRTVEELGPYFEALPSAGFCFDVAHADAIDDELDEAHAMLDAFGERLRHVHVSSLDEQSHHVALHPEDERRFAGPLARCRDVPWILEGPLTIA